MTGYTTSEVSDLVGLPPGQVRAFARAGLLSASRDRRGWYRYTFQDVVLLRTAKGLAEAYVPSRRIWRTLRTLKRQLPHGRPLSTVRVMVQNSKVLVRDRELTWQPETGQLQMDFAMSDLTKEIAPMVHKAAAAAIQEQSVDADDWFNLGIDLELVDELEQAKRAYHHALELGPEHADAHVNLGRLLHTEGHVAQAESHYRAALDSSPRHVTALFNLANALEDRKRFEDAIDTYKKLLGIDPEFADAHYNLSCLFEQRGNKQAALRHLARYKALMGGATPT